MMKDILILGGCFFMGMFLGLIIIRQSVKMVRKKFDQAVKKNEKDWTSDNK